MSLRSRAVVAVLAVLLASCSDVQDRIDQVRDSASELTDQARFCLTIARTVSAIESGSPQTAAEAAEEAFAQAPEEVRADAEAVLDAIRSTDGGAAEALEDPDVRAAAERLRDRTADLCDPSR